MDDAAPCPVPPEVLLAHRDWVRALARSLVRDTASADDLEQDTWVRALTSMPRETRSPRAWLGTVLRNRLRDTVRVDRRRAARDATAARDGAEPGADDVAARAEMHRHVLEAVLALDAPFRDAVLLRYFEGLTPAEIAQRQGIDPGTVRTRLHRGLERLRARLDADHGGDGTSWRSALLPLCGAPEVAPGGHGAATGSHVRRSAWSSVTAALVVAGATTAWLLLHDAGAPAPRPPGATATTAPARPLAASGPRGRATPPIESRAGAPGAAPATVAASPSGSSSAVPLTPQPSQRLEITVVFADGVPAAGARVEVRDGDSFAKSGFAHLLDAGAAGADGVATLSAPMTGDVRLVARHGKLAAVAPVAAASTFGGAARLRLATAGSVRGTLVSTSGAPVAGADVRLTLTGDVFGPGGAARTDAQGTFDLGTLPLEAFDSPANLEVTARGFPVLDRTVTSDDAARGALRIEIEPALRLRGRCLTADGRPLSPATVSCDHSSADVETGPDGRFAFDDLDPAGMSSKDRSLWIECDGFAMRRIDVPDAALAAGDVGDVVLVPGAELRGRVVDPAGDPVARASVRAEGRSIRRTVAYATSDAEGRFVLEHLGDDVLDVHAHENRDADPFSGASGTTGDVPVRSAGPPSGDVTVVLTTARSVLAEFTDADGAPSPVTDVFIEAEADVGAAAGAAEPSPSFAEGYSSETPFGSVRIHPRGASRLRVRILFPGRDPVTLEGVQVLDDRETRLRVVVPAAPR